MSIMYMNRLKHSMRFLSLVGIQKFWYSRLRQMEDRNE